MGHDKRVRVVKRGQRGQAADPAESARQSPASTARREVKDVVSGWVREHQRRSEEFRRNYSTLLSELGLTAPPAGGKAFGAMPLLAANK